MILLFFLGSLLLFDLLTVNSSAALAGAGTPTPTSTPTPRSAVFSPATANKLNPGDILQELFYPYGAGGGSDDDPCYGKPVNVPSLIKDSITGDQELFTPITLDSCGWQGGEKVDIQVHYPNGRVVKDQREVPIHSTDSPAYLGYWFMTAWGDPAGLYRVTFHGPSGEVVANIKILRPLAPRVVMMEQTDLLLYHFSPNEKVRLIAYAWCKSGIDGYCLTAWQTLQVDGQGNLLVKMPRTDIWLYILGDKSGEVETYFRWPDVFPASYKMIKRTAVESQVLISSCPGAPPQRLKVDFFGEICTKKNPVKLRLQPKQTGLALTGLEPGTSFQVIGGPVCADRTSWWQVSWWTNSRTQTGWVPEGGDQTDPYYLCPGE
jgi:hypothetical protein